MLEVMLILIAASVAMGLSLRYRVPSIPLMIGTGLLLGIPGWLGNANELQQTLQLGLAFLLFVVGSELDIDAVGEQKRTALVFGLVQFALLGTISFGVAIWLGFGQRGAAYIGLAIAPSSTLVVVSLLRRREQFFESFGRLALGVVLLQNLLVILLLPVLTSATTAQGARGVGATLAMALFAWACSRWFAPKLMLHLQRDEESLLLVMLATLFAFVGAAYWLDIPIWSGAFLAGIALSRFPVSGLVRGQLGSLADFFIAVFFVTLGVLLGAVIGNLHATEVIFNAVLLAAILLLAPFLLIPLARRFGLTTRSSIEVTNLLAQSGELSILVVLLGLQYAHIDESVLGTIVLLTVLTMVISPAISSDRFTWRIMHLLPGADRKGVSVDRNDHLIFIGCGTSTRDIIRCAASAGEKIVAVDDDSAVVDQLAEIDGVEAIRGDGADPWLLRRLGLRDAKLVVSTMRRISDHERLMRLAGDTQVIVRTFEHDAAERLRNCGATVVSEADEGERVFLEWFDEWSSQSENHDDSTKGAVV
ncbi:MAG: cation:proton antiporter [Phycisphaerales bacterium JB050]